MNESDKPIKICRYCKKEVRNLGIHIANNHPLVLEKIDEEESAPTQTAYIPQNTPQNVQKSSINDMVRDKLDIMLNIKLIEMLSSSKDVSLQDLKKSIEPQQNTQISEVIALHDAIYKNQPQPSVNINAEGDGGGWVELATAAIPLIKEMLPKRQEEKQNDTKHTGAEERNIGIRRLIPQEIARDTRSPSSISGESSASIPTEQPNSTSTTTSNKGA